MSTTQIKAHVTPAGRLILDKKIKLQPGPVLVSISRPRSNRSRSANVEKQPKATVTRKSASGSISESDVEYRRRRLQEMHAQLEALELPSDPHPDKTDDELIYGYTR